MSIWGPKVALLTIGDGRDDLLTATMASFREQVRGGGEMPYVHVDDRDHRLGFCGAIREGWRRLLEQPDPFDYVFHLEEDWRFTRPFRIDHAADLLAHHSELAQVALRRNAVAPDELAAGGLVELWPDLYAQRHHHLSAGRVVDYLEHGLYFTTNPCLYRRELLDREWPQAPRCEERFGMRLHQEGYRFAMWGELGDAPWVEHTGHTRTGGGY